MAILAWVAVFGALSATSLAIRIKEEMPTGLDMPPCSSDGKPDLTKFVADPLQGYFVEFPDSPNLARLQCQLSPSFRPLALEASVKHTEEDFKAWEEEGLIAWDHILGGWDRDPVKYASIYMSHLNIWRRVAAAPEQWTGIFEGDAIFRTDFHEVLADLRSQQSMGTIPPADIVYLGHCINNDCANQPVVGTLKGGVTLVESNMPICSHAYLLSRTGAQILRDNALPMRMNNDDMPMRSLIRDGTLKSLSLCPQIARQVDKEWMPTAVAPSWLYGLYLPINYVAVNIWRFVGNHSVALSVLVLLLAFAVLFYRYRDSKKLPEFPEVFT